MVIIINTGGMVPPYLIMVCNFDLHLEDGGNGKSIPG